MDGEEWKGKDGLFAKAFEFYGPRSLLVRRGGYRSETRVEELNAPWYSWFPLDFITEFLIPWRFRDQRVFVVKLRPAAPLSAAETNQLLKRAELFAKESGSELR